MRRPVSIPTELLAGEAIGETQERILLDSPAGALQPYIGCVASPLGLPFAVSDFSPGIDSDYREAKASPS